MNWAEATPESVRAYSPVIRNQIQAIKATALAGGVNTPPLIRTATTEGLVST